MSQIVGIVDYSVNNISSITKFLNKLDINFKVINKSKDIHKFGFLILPGVGSFNQGMKNLNNKNFNEELKKYVCDGKYLMGICLGMQLLFNYSEEFLNIEGLNLIQGKCYKIPNTNVSVPHMGWNELLLNKTSKLIPHEEKFLAYFVHSYFVKPKNQKIVTSYVNHGINFCSSIESENIFGFQFHPEKSFDIGFKIFTNFINIK